MSDPMTRAELVERLAKTLEPLAWAALGLHDTLAQKSRRIASERKAEAVLSELDALGLAIMPREASDGEIEAGARAICEAEGMNPDGELVEGQPDWIYRTAEARGARRAMLAEGEVR